MSAAILAWMLTYLAHSTLLLSVAWLAWRLLPGETLAVKEALWKMALVGGLLTATLQLGLGVEPRLGAWRLGGLEHGTIAAADTVRERSAAISRTAPSAAAETPFDAHEDTFAGTPSAPRSLGPVPVVEPDSQRASPALSTSAAGSGGSVATRSSWSAWVITIWAFGALGLVGWLAASCLVLARRLADRRGIADGPLESLLSALQRAARMPDVRLSASARIASPLAFGWRRREICLPERVASDMPELQQELVLAHELAHHARRDPVWLIALRLFESVFFFQPLNRVARRCLQEVAEYRCDDWAVERTGRPVTLARCLADVAEWNLRRGAMLPVPSLAVERRRLGRRVERLLDRSYPFPAAPRPKWLGVGAAVALAGIVLLAPGVSSGHSEPPPPEPEPAPEAPRPPVSPQSPPSRMPPAPAVADGPPAPPSPAFAPRVLPTPELRVIPTPAAAPAPAPVAPTRPAAVSPRIAPAPAVRVRSVSPRLAPLAPAAPAVLVAPSLPSDPREEAPVVAPASPVSLVPSPIFESAPTPAPPPPVRPEASPRAPLPPAPDDEWVIHEDAWPGAAPVPLAELAEIDSLLAAVVEPLTPSLAGEWARLAQEMAAAGELASSEALAELVAYTRDLAEVAELSPRTSERLAELSLRMAEGARPDPKALERIARLSAKLATRSEHDPEALARIAALSRELAATAGPDEEARAVYEDYALRVGEDQLLSEEERAELARLREEIHRDMERRAAERRDEMGRLRDEIRAELEASRPDREEMSRLRAELRAELEASRPAREELQRLYEERAREHRGRLADGAEARREVERIGREDLRRLREAEQESRREVDRLRREVRERVTRDEAEALRAEIERLRAELRRLRDEE